MLTVEESREQRVCRVCGNDMPKPENRGGRPLYWQFDFGRELMPEAITLNFGAEYAHTDCLPKPTTVATP